jgi:HlyD family secretion protein
VRTSSAQLDQLKAEINRTKAQLEAATNAYNRSDKLFKEGVISAAEFETAKNNLRAAESGLNAAEANLKASESSLVSAQENVRVSELGITSASARLRELNTSLQKTIITAPVSGIVSKLNVEKGERVVGTLQMTGTEMMRIANLRSMEVQVDVSENDILKVTVGDEADVEVDAYLGRKFKGKVTEIANSASNVGTTTSLNSDQVTNFVVKIRIDPSSYLDLLKDGRRYPFRPGMSASVDVFTQTADNTITVPLIAVTAREDKKDDKKVQDQDEEESVVNNAQKEKEKKDDLIKEIVFVIVGDTVAVKEVKTGIQDNDHIEILSGIAEGDMVISGPYSAIARKLKSGSKIKLMDKKKAEEKKE